MRCNERYLHAIAFRPGRECSIGSTYGRFRVLTTKLRRCVRAVSTYSGDLRLVERQSRTSSCATERIPTLGLCLSIFHSGCFPDGCRRDRFADCRARCVLMAHLEYYVCNYWLCSCSPNFEKRKKTEEKRNRKVPWSDWWSIEEELSERDNVDSKTTPMTATEQANTDMDSSGFVFCLHKKFSTNLDDARSEIIGDHLPKIW